VAFLHFGQVSSVPEMMNFDSNMSINKFARNGIYHILLKVQLHYMAYSKLAHLFSDICYGCGVMELRVSMYILILYIKRSFLTFFMFACKTVGKKYVPILFNDVLSLIVFVFACNTETEQGVAQAIIRSVIDFKRDPWPRVSDNAKDLVRGMLNPDPKLRLTAQQVLGNYQIISLVDCVVFFSIYYLFVDYRKTLY
jgi:hypothetical protein